MEINPGPGAAEELADYRRQTYEYPKIHDLAEGVERNPIGALATVSEVAALVISLLSGTSGR